MKDFHSIFLPHMLLERVPALCPGWGHVPYDCAFGALTCGQGHVAHDHTFGIIREKSL